MSTTFKLISSMEKCFLDESIDSKPALASATALRGEEYAFEVAYTADEGNRNRFTVTVDSALADCITVREIENVPVRLATYAHADDHYLRKTPGLYPDLLRPIDPTGNCYSSAGMLKSLWMTVKVPVDFAPGTYPIVLTFLCGDGQTTTETLPFTVLDAVLPKQETIYTDWFHADCIADYYEYEVFSDAHWNAIRNFMQTAVDNGINMILTPVFTPALDTAVGGERTTTQLVDVCETEDGWAFGFDKLEKWIAIAQSVGVAYFEIAHLYTQWGVEHAPKVMGVDKSGTYRRLFGWETDSCSDEYRTFLRAFLTALIAKLKELGVDKQCYYHISDEPGYDHLETYLRAKNQIADLLEDYTIIDALSKFDFYQTGAVDTPIPGVIHIEPFLEAGVQNLWTYYCCSGCVDVSNRFVAMSMERNRVIGIQMWKYNIVGFLQWGYNFYNTQHSTRHIDPYLVTDGDYWVPAGDAFSVYPGEGGVALETLHLKGFAMALQDLRAMKLAEEKVGRNAILAIVEEEMPITFRQYPRRDGWVREVREKINAILAE